MKITDVKGKIFGKLFVDSFSHTDKHRHAVWNCTCACGNKTKVVGNSLRMGKILSCGCNSFRKGLENPHFTGCGEISGYMWCHVKAAARKRSIKFMLSVERAWGLFLQQNRRCALSGVELRFSEPNLSWKERAKRTTASLDRKNPAKGYTLGNVQWVHKKVNLMKHVSTDKEFIEWCRAVAKYQEGEK
jgi:hypothetical protein